MIVDLLQNKHRYSSLYKGMESAFNYLITEDLANIAPGRYPINGDDLFALVQEYDTLDAAGEQMEAHKKYIDLQYMISGAELVGHGILTSQLPSKAYDTEHDFMLFADAPSFFTKMEAGTFMIFYPTDMHMPCIKSGSAAPVKKVVIKVRVQD